MSGSVLVEDAPATSKPISIEIAPAHAGTPAFETARRLESRALHTEPDDRGFFQLKQVPEGTYTLKASADGLGEIAFGPFTVYAGRETILPEPLVLSPPLAVEVSVRPPIHPTQGSWKGVFLPDGGPDARNHQSVRGDVADDGIWLATDLRPGSYRLSIEDRFGNPWFDEVVAIGRWTTRLDAAIPVVTVEGRVSLDGEPVRARLRLRRLGVGGDLDDRREVSLYSDIEGRVRGDIPESGTWDMSALLKPGGAWCDQGQVEIPPSEDGAAVEVEFELHGQGFHGVVWSPEGEPVEGARIIALRLEGRLPRGSGSTAETGPDGRFEFTSLSAGRYSVYALGSGSLQGSSSRRSEVAVSDGGSPSVELSLEPLRDLGIRVVSERGPVIGAAVRAEPEMADPYRRVGPVERTTDVTGTVEVKVPGSAETLTLLVLAPGYGARLLEVSPPPEDDPLVITVDDAAGILALDLPPDQGTGRSLSRLRHGSASEDLFSLAGWATVDPATGLWLLEMEMGEWWLCPAGTRDERCDGGFLTPGGILELSLETD
ncbi:MAG: carboxypeptidase regulatory-like domain-containing protein [Acidobacteria bacterium]|nr:carboxypeptidase regulatory-like domain-containing protein [Acidobacteriota bacterium]